MRAIKPNKLHTLIGAIILAIAYIGCAAVPEPYIPASATTLIQDAKTIRIYGSHRKRDTGIWLAKGDTYTIIATGRVRLNQGGRLTGPGESRFAKTIDDGLYGAVFPSSLTGGTFTSPASGKLYLGILDRYPDDNTGHIDATIIVWKTNDYVEIANVLEEMESANAGNRGITDASRQAAQMKNVAVMEAKASAEIEQTRNELKEIQENVQPAADQRQILELEKRLAKLTATLAELEQMKRELGMERQKSEQLAQQLAEKQKREQQLLSKLSKGAKSPPLLLITAPIDGSSTEARQVRLRGVAEDDRGLQRFEVYLNGRRLPDDAGRGVRLVDGHTPRRLEFDRPVALVKGPNRIRIHIIDSDGLFTEKILSVARIERRRNLWAVVVGINAYPNLRRLNYAVADAQAFYDWLVNTNQVPAKNVILLLDDRATLKRLRSALGTRLKNAAGKDDLVIIFFAGHGAVERDMLSPDGDGLEKYLLAYDTDPNDLYATALPMREIAHVFNRIRSERLIFLADACYSGASGGRTIRVGGLRANLSDAFLARLAGGKGKIIITASGANEVSVEKDELRHGVFTYYLLEGLHGAADSDGDGIITVDEAYSYVAVAVPRATGQEQHPVKKGTVEGQLLMGVVP